MRSVTVTTRHSRVETLKGDVLILPTVADRFDTSPFNTSIYEKAGRSVRETFRRNLPLRIGNVAVTEGGALPVDRIVHAPVQTAPDVPTTEENLQIGLRSGLVTADEEDVETILLSPIIPDGGEEALNVSSVAETIVRDLEQYPPVHFERLILFSTDQEWLEAVSTVLS